MKILDAVYKLYKHSLENKNSTTEIEININKDNINSLRNAQKSAANDTSFNGYSSTDIQVGSLFMIDNLFFVVSNTDNYPYEVFVASPFFELAADKDIIVEDNDKEKWVIESIVRYVTTSILEASIKISSIDEEYINIMKSYIKDAKKLPKDMVGTPYNDFEDSEQKQFRENEIRRSLFLTLENIEEGEDITDHKVISIKNSQAETNIINRYKTKMAAASFDSFINTRFGEMIQKDELVTINFKNEFVGETARIFIDKMVLYEGVLPRKLDIKTKIDKLEILKNNLSLEVL